MHNALRRSYFSQEMHSKCQDDTVTMTTMSSASEPRLGPGGLLQHSQRGDNNVRVRGHLIFILMLMFRCLNIMGTERVCTRRLAADDYISLRTLLGSLPKSKRTRILWPYKDAESQQNSHKGLLVCSCCCCVTFKGILHTDVHRYEGISPSCSWLPAYNFVSLCFRREVL